MTYPYKPTGGYGFARAKSRAFAAIRELWRARQTQGMSQADLAERLGRDAGWVSRKLSGPSNWTLRTFGDLADALEGEIEISVTDLRSGADLSNYDAYEDDPPGIIQGDQGINQSGRGGADGRLEAAA